MTNVWAVMMVKDEADVVGGVIHHLASEGLRGIAILNNGSTDATLDEIDKATLELRNSAHPYFEVRVHDDPEVGYYQSRKITALLHDLARTKPVDWIVPVDADEIWHADVPLADLFAKAHADGIDVVDAQLLSHFGTNLDPAAPTPFQAFEWREPEVAPLPKVAFRWEEGVVVAQGAHGVHFAGRPSYEQTGEHLGFSGLTVRHFPYRSIEQFIRKARNGAAAYAATDLPADMGNHWRRFGTMSDDDLTELYLTTYYFPHPAESGMVHDPAPFRRWDR